MDDLIEALTIFRKYKNEDNPTHCNHDELWIMGVGKDDLTDEDHKRVSELGFHWSSNDDVWKSFRFGSA